MFRDGFGMRQIEPTRKNARIETLDVIRGIAICGILPFNIPIVGDFSLNEQPAFLAAWNLD